MDSKRKVSQVFNNNAQGSRLRGRPKYRWWNCLQTDINKCKRKNLKEWLRNRDVWEKCVKEGKVCLHWSVVPSNNNNNNNNSKSFRKCVSSIPGKPEVRELQKTAILGTAHILRKVLT
jgi:hypothetical protein